MKPVIRLSALIFAGFCCQCSFSWAQTTSVHPKPSRTASHPAPPENTVVIPGPLRSFLRMAGISQQIAPNDVLPLVARNAYATGYLNGVPTEYLRLLERYLHQARASDDGRFERHPTDRHLCRSGALVLSSATTPGKPAGKGSTLMTSSRNGLSPPPTLVSP